MKGYKMKLQLHEAPSCYLRNQASQTTLWDGMDNEESYKTHVKNRYNELKEHGWVDPEVEILYRHNRYGFRDDDFDDRPCVLALGCSFTYGVGIPENATWPRVLSEIIGVHVWNLGISGGSIDTCYRFLNYYVRLDPKFVVLLTPPSNRFEICSSEQSFLSVMPIRHISSPYHDSLQQVIKNYTLNNEFQSINFVKSLRAMQQICNENNIKLYSLSSDYDLVSQDKARDLAHPGVKAHQLIAKKFAEMIQKDSKCN